MKKLSLIVGLAFAVGAFAVGAFAVGACAGMNTKWQHPEIPAAEWGVDGAQCRYDARRKAERDNNQISEAEMNLYGDEDGTIDTMLINAGVKKHSRALFAECMRDLGYVPIE